MEGGGEEAPREAPLASPAGSGSSALSPAPAQGAAAAVLGEADLHRGRQAWCSGRRAQSRGDGGGREEWRGRRRSATRGSIGVPRRVAPRLLSLSSPARRARGRRVGPRQGAALTG
ncbi:unnamed protein product [Triticum turgidum subsp. durum]|uniref:Uncharacterized protein n=1 Tax=Triticum turgidum subsp. durum TaxID=4567 RepID=A0A9R0Q3H1_TRITD|nr:unnamed protein product [Triticum turgidum subsp. durum]